MILYLMWGLLFGMLFHYAMVVTQQEVVFSEILLIILGWPIFLIMFVFTIINEFRK